MKKIQLPPYLQKKVLLSNILFFLFFVFSIIALINPKWGTDYAAVEFRRGLDTVFAIDISRSMDIRDIQSGGSRLERGLSIAKEAALAVPGGRFAAAIGRSRGYLSVPLTYDNEAVINFLESLDTSAMTGRSTNLQSLVEAAADAFQTAGAARRVIVLISDGEAHFGILRNALNQCIKDEITIIAVGVGSDEGREVDGIELAAGAAIPISRRDSASLRMAAERTGGIYIDGNREDAASHLRVQLLQLIQGQNFSPDSERQTEPKQRRSLFVILAIIAYGLSKFVTAGCLRGKTTAAAIIFILLFSSCTEGKLLLIEANYLYSRGRYDEAAVPYLKALEHEDAAPYAEYGLGITYYSMDEEQAALNYYTNSQERLKNISAAEHRELRYRIHYNTGIINFEAGDYNAAAAAFKEALKIDSSKIDAKRNLEISLMSIAGDSSRERQPEIYNETKEILFEYARQQEQPYWQSGEWQADEKFDGPDY